MEKKLCATGCVCAHTHRYIYMVAERLEQYACSRICERPIGCSPRTDSAPDLSDTERKAAEKKAAEAKVAAEKTAKEQAAAEKKAAAEKAAAEKQAAAQKAAAEKLGAF